MRELFASEPPDEVSYDILERAGQEDLEELKRSMARASGASDRSHTPETIHNLDWRALLPGAPRLRLAQYERMVADENSLTYFDLDQNPLSGQGRVSHGSFPTLLTHSSLWSHRSKASQYAVTE